MRSHRRFDNLVPKLTTAQFDIIRAEHLAVGRLEPVLQFLRGRAMLDVVFRGGETIAVVPFVVVDCGMLLMPDMEVLVWPKSVAQVVGAARLDEAGERLTRWIRAISLARSVNTPVVRIFDPEFEAAYRRAQERKVLGAALYADAIASAAPYIFAQRFAHNRGVSIDAEDGALGAALLGKYSRTVSLVRRPGEGAAFDRRWFGVDAECAHPPAECSVEIVDAATAPSSADSIVVHAHEDAPGERIDVAEPIPIDNLVSFDPEDAAPVRSFGVAVREPRLLRADGSPVRPEAKGGSYGSILLALRPNGFTAPDADVESALELAGRLRAEGIRVEVSVAVDRRMIAEADVVHAVGVGEYGFWATRLAAAVIEADKPFFITPELPPVSGAPTVGTRLVESLSRWFADDVHYEMLLRQLSLRRVSEGENDFSTPPAIYASYQDELRRTFAAASAVFASGPVEARFLASEFDAPRIIETAAIVPPLAPPRDVTHLVGTSPFALIHAPIERRSNQLLAVYAAEAAGVPLVVAGEVVDVGYYELVRGFAGASTRFITSPDPGQVAALYRSADVFLDASWYTYGLSRTVNAVLCGAWPALSRDGYGAAHFGSAATFVDPASWESIAAALRLVGSAKVSERASESKSAALALADPVRNFHMVVATYAAAASLRQKATV